jgi:hypothetical protein
MGASAWTIDAIRSRVDRVLSNVVMEAIDLGTETPSVGRAGLLLDLGPLP